MSRKTWIMCVCAAAAGAAGQVRAEGLTAPRLTLDPIVVTLADAASQPAAAPEKDWMDQIKNPVSWLSWGADQRIRWEYGNNFITLSGQAAGHERDWFRFRSRVWLSIAPMENVALNARLIWEGRHYQNPQTPEWDDGQGEFDIFNVKVTVPQLATTLTVGRQEITLGDGWLVADGTNGDGSTTMYFEAVRSTTQLKDLQTSVDLIYINNYSSPDQWLPTLGDSDRFMNEGNERGVVAYLTNKSIQNVEISPYFIYRHDRGVVTGADANPLKRGVNDSGDIYVFGARVVDAFTENLTGKVEGAYEFGDVDYGFGAVDPDTRRTGPRRLSAWGLNSRFAYNFRDTMQNELRLNFEYLTGDNSGTTGINEGFEPLWGRWPRFSELIGYNFKGETRIYQMTNYWRIGPAYAVRPTENTELELNYNAIFADQNTNAGAAGYTDHGNFRGHLFTAIFRYKISRNLSGHFWAEYFVPGNYYDDTKRDNAVFARAEIVLTF
jgi:hypothetical protein